MSFSELFTAMLNWIIQFALFLPFQVLQLVGYFLPPCSDFGVAILNAQVTNEAQQWMRFVWPVLQFVPIQTIWGLISATILYWIFWFIMDHIVPLMNFIGKWWPIIVALFVIIPLVNFFLSDSWMDHTFFEEVFSTSTRAGISGGGLGGGGGGGW